MSSAIEKGYRGMGMEGSIARWYEKSMRKDMSQYSELAERLQAGLPLGADVLEVAPGPAFWRLRWPGFGSFMCRLSRSAILLWSWRGTMPRKRELLSISTREMRRQCRSQRIAST